MFERAWKPGDWVIYRMTKHGVAPGRRAHHVSASRKGESYNYLVDKFWVVERVEADGNLQIRTPGGKVRTISASDPNLRRARWWHRLQWGNRFRSAESTLHHDDEAQSHASGGSAGAA